jgi:hypothetical protein
MLAPADSLHPNNCRLSFYHPTLLFSIRLDSYVALVPRTLQLCNILFIVQTYGLQLVQKLVVTAIGSSEHVLRPSPVMAEYVG